MASNIGVATGCAPVTTSAILRCPSIRLPFFPNMFRNPIRTLSLPSPAGSGTRSPTQMVVLALGVLTLVSAVQVYAVRRASNESASITEALLFGMATWGVWAAAFPAIAALGRRFDFREGRRVRSAVVHAGAALIVHVPATALAIVVGLMLFGGEAPKASEFPRLAFAGTRLQLTVIVYAALLGLARFAELRRRLRDEQARAAHSEALATQARLTALAARLQPHFLFNALHAVGALIAEDPVRARTMLVHIGDLLRDALADDESGDVTLEEEFRLLERYLAVEAVRFADRLQVTLTCDEVVRDQRVPRFLLQPLVENAIQHGIAPNATGGQLTVRAHLVDTGVCIAVHNDGLPPAPQRTERVGLGMTRDRLRTRYGPGATLELAASPGGGTTATLLIPRPGASAGST